MTDKEIIKAIERDTSQGFRMLLHTYQERLYWHIRRMVALHDDAADALQETFTRAFSSIGSFKPDKPLGPWLYRIATNEAIRIADRKPMLSIDSDGLAAHDIPADEHIDYSDIEAVKLHRAILTLPPKQRAVFSLRYYDELDYSQIAEITGCSMAAAKQNYHLAKGRITDFLTEQL